MIDCSPTRERTLSTSPKIIELDRTLPVQQHKMDLRRLPHFFSLIALSICLLTPAAAAAAAAAAEPSSSFSAALETLQKQIGYEFQAIDLLRRAMTHPSYSRDNCRTLGILGLSTIESAVSLRFLQADIDGSPAALARRISQISGVDACAAVGERLGLHKIIRVSPKTNATSPSVVCSAYRAIFGAVSLDSGKVDTGGDVFWRVNGGGILAAAM